MKLFKQKKMKVFNKVGVFVLLLFAVNVVAQETIAKDSLKRMLNGNITTVEKIDVLKKLAELESDKQQRFSWITDAIEEANKKDMPLEEAKCRIQRAKFYYGYSVYDTSRSDFLKAMDLISRGDSITYLADCINGLGVLHLEKGELDSAEIKYVEAIKIWEPLDEVEKILTAKNNIVNCYSMRGDLMKADSIINEIIEMSIEEGLTDRLKSAYNSKVISFGRRSMLDSALVYVEKLMEVLNPKGDKKLWGLAYLNKGNILYSNNKVVEASKEYIKALKIFEKLSDKNGVASMRYTLGLVFNKLHQHQKSREYFLSALKDFEVMGVKPQIANAHYQLGVNTAWIDSTDIKRQLYHYIIADSLYGLIDNKEGVARTAQIIGVTYRKKQEYDKSYEYLMKANKICHENSYIGLLFNNTFSIGLHYDETGNYQKALQYFNKAIDLSFKSKDSPLRVYESKAKVLNKMGKGDEAYVVLHTAMILRDSLFNLEKVKAINEIEAEYQNRIKKDSIHTLQIQNEAIASKAKQRNYIIVATIAFLIAAILWGYSSFKNYKKGQYLNLVLENKNAHLQSTNDQLVKDIEEAKTSQNPKEALRGKFLELNNRAKTKIKLSNIIYLEAINRQVLIHSSGEEQVYKNWETLKSFADLLTPTGLFVQIHRSFIINVDHMEYKPNGEIIMSNGKALNISDSYKNEVEDYLKDFTINSTV